MTATTTVAEAPRRRGRSEALTASDVLTVIAWRDPVVEQTPGAIATASDDALVWYLPSIGSVGMVVAHRFAAYAAEGPSTWPMAVVAATFGFGASLNRIRHTFERLERFGIIRRYGTKIAVRLWLPPLTYRQRCQLPAYLAAAYDAR